jgi:hypothetical protein
VALAVVLMLAVVAGCSSGSKSSGSAGATDDTIPLAKDNPTTKMFAALNTFQTCLKGENVKFIGAPDPANPSSPTNDPNYIKALSTCAAKSHILQAQQDQQAALDNLTPAQIKKGNEGFLLWRECMIGRGWGMPEPKPDEKGRLFSFGGTTAPAFQPPPGQDIVSTGDYQACAVQTQKKRPDAFPG